MNTNHQVGIRFAPGDPEIYEFELISDHIHRQDGQLQRARRADSTPNTPLSWGFVCIRHGRLMFPTHRGERAAPQATRCDADVAQLVAHNLAKVGVAGSNPVVRSRGVTQPFTVEWPSGEATACKAVHTGSIPVSTSRD